MEFCVSLERRIWFLRCAVSGLLLLLGPFMYTFLDLFSLLDVETLFLDLREAVYECTSIILSLMFSADMVSKSFLVSPGGLLSISYL